MKSKGGLSLEQTKLERGFESLLEGTGILKTALEIPFLEGYLENMASLLEGDVPVVAGVPNPEEVARLQALYGKVNALDLTPDEKRKITQLLLLKGSLEDHLSANHQLTPDAIGYFCLSLAQQLLPQQDIKILDPTVGMGNLLATVVTGLQAAERNVTAFGVENDDLLIELAAVNSEWLQETTQYFHQDALQPLLLEPVDAVIADLPVGYYPNDNRAKEFKVSELVKEGHVYAHHLLIEASFKYLKEGAWGMYIVPANLFASEQAKAFTWWFQEEAYLQSFITLPKNLFKNPEAQKAVLLLQKPGGQAKQAQEVLLAQVPSLNDMDKLQKFFQQFSAWQAQQLA